MKVTSVAQASPFKQAMLSPEECYILDNGVDGNIFVWKGANCRDGLLFLFCAVSDKAATVALVICFSL